MPEVSASNHWHRPDRLKDCILCGEKKPLSEFYSYGYVTKQGKQSTRYESRCSLCSRVRRRWQYQNNIERETRTNAAYREKNRDSICAQMRDRQKTPEGRASKAYHQRLRKARLRSNSEDDILIRDIYAEAKEVERIVAVCPVFDIPELGKKMHVDHIQPLSKGGKHAASNLQILPIGINMRKGAKCPR